MSQLSGPEIACPLCGNKDRSLLEESETRTRSGDVAIVLHETVCSVCSHIWNRRMSVIPFHKEPHGK